MYFIFFPFRVDSRQFFFFGGGFPESQESQISKFTKVISNNSSIVSIDQNQSIAEGDYLLHATDDAVLAELERRQTPKAQADRTEGRKKKEKDNQKDSKDKDNQIQLDTENDENMGNVEFEKSSKWKEQHMTLAESRC